MKKIYVSFLTLICGLGMNAQLTQSNNAPAVGDMWMTTGVSSVGVLPGASGSGATWNFTGITTTSSTASYTVVTPASTGSSSAYPSANAGVSAGSTNNTFYNSSGSMLQFYGGNLTMAGVAVVLTYTTPATYAVYPMNLGVTATNTIAGSVNILGQNGTFAGTATTTADGTGTLMLPGAGNTFNNVTRVKVSQSLTYTLSFGGGTFNQDRWDYYSPSTAKASLFSITNSTLNSGFGTTTETVVAINSAFVTGVKEQVSQITEFLVYPNPAKDHITMNFTSAAGQQASYEIVNALGQTVAKNELGSQEGTVQVSISLNNFNSGIYFVKLKVGNSAAVKKITVQ